MKHHDRRRKLGRTRDERRALLRSLAEALIAHGKITTTLPKAKEIRSYVEKLVTKAKKNDLAAKRLVISRLGTPARAEKLFSEIAPRYLERPGGYTRIIKLPRRLGDGSAMAVIEFV